MSNTARAARIERRNNRESLIANYLRSLSADDLKRIATFILYDTTVEDLKDWNRQKLLKRLYDNIEGGWFIYCREGKSGDDYTLDELKEEFEKMKQA